MRTRIHWKLMLTYVLVIGTVVLVIGLLAGYRTHRDQVNRLQEDMVRQARLAGVLAQDRLSQGMPADAIADTIGFLIHTRVTLIAPDGQVIGDSEVEASVLLTLENHATRPEVRQAMASGVGSAVRHSTTVKRDMLYVAVAMPDASRQLRILRLAEPMAFIENMDDQTRRTLLVASILGILLSLVLCYGASLAISRPIRRMTESARAVARGDFSIRAHESSSEELADMARTLNEMSAQLKSRIDQITEEKSLLEAVLASATEGIVVTDPHGAILSVNAALRELFEVPPTQVLGRPCIEVVRNPDVVAAIEQTLGSGEKTRREIALLGPTERRLEMHVAPILLGGSIIGAVGIFYDVTEMRRMERLRRDFVANVSHELRTPLTAIKGCAETLADGAIEDKTAAGRFVETIRSHADRLSALIDDLLSLSRIESGHPDVRRVRRPVRPIVESALRVVEASAAQKRIALQADIPDGLPDLLCDDTLIEQALVNLLDNAIKYTPEGGMVTVTLRIAESAHSEIRNPKSEIGGWVEMVVEDTGIGIPPEHLLRIFERFYRVDRARSRALGGTGLGLSIVKHIVEAHGGTVGAESEVGRGSVFTIGLPAA